MSQNPPNWPETQGLVQDKPKKKRGCMFWGCTGCGVLFAIILIVSLIVFAKIKSFINQYAQDTPRPVPTITYNQAELDAAEKKFDSFQETVEIDQLEKNTFNPTITISEREINMLVNNEEHLKDSFYVDFEENSLNLEISVKIPKDVPFVGGKYFNGKAQGGITILDGLMKLNITHAEAGGKELPENLHVKISEGIEKNLLEDKDSRLWLSTINKMEIRKDEVHVEFNHDMLLRQLKMEKERRK